MAPWDDAPAPFAADGDADDVTGSELAERFNKESGKVNAQLSAFPSALLCGRDKTGAWASNSPVGDIEFSRLAVPTLPMPPRLNVKEYAPERLASHRLPIPIAASALQLLKKPPEHAYVHGVLSINWVLAAIGRQHFITRKGDGRLVLRQLSELRTRGEEWGLQGALLGWLKGDDANVSANEEGMMLTREFFEHER
ncbi:hypothetical protein K504DRAFT_260119 [Pleomassaria siparia CBS 279.74]|uniref:Uncharacterized protein n=1 Tax=Pleomassaria siparia CBS 279.74 TaxID=1314801 RepID=A0A6G1KBT1_9PLEO|nr:hypothetical protein K504DRAFT_260119 [Pleomassaria siparia CBS 279.74]